MIKAEQAVDEFIDSVTPHLEEGDIITDVGNSHFPDTIRRTAKVKKKGLLISSAQQGQTAAYR